MKPSNANNNSFNLYGSFKNKYAPIPTQIGLKLKIAWCSDSEISLKALIKHMYDNDPKNPLIINKFLTWLSSGNC